MLKIKSVLLDYQKTLSGVCNIPQISWKIVSNKNNVMQKSYRMQLSDNQDFDVLIYDSSVVESDASAHVFPGIEIRQLKSLSKYYIRVMIWDNDEASEWSTPVSFITGIIDNSWNACFISAETKADKSNSKGTYIRREFDSDCNVKEAYACVTALGLYKLYINGEKVGNDEMTPGWTSYHHHLCYQTYDVTELIHKGCNAIGAHIGAGWYKGLMGFIHTRNNYGDQTGFLLKLVIRYMDGSEKIITTDSDNWYGANSPITFSEIYDGELYDSRLEQEGWNLPDFNMQIDDKFHYLTKEEEQLYFRDPLKNPYSDEEKENQIRTAAGYYPENTLWHKCQSVEFPFEVLTPQTAGMVKLHEHFPAKEIIVTPSGETVIDFGQNLAGRVSFKVRGKRGELAHIKCFEVLDADKNAYFDNLRSAKAEVKYILKGEKEEVFCENFSFQGYRYIKLINWPCKPELSDFTSYSMYSDMSETGSFECSDPLVNQLQHNLNWSLRSNFLDVPTDCPQRDERMGWTGDAQIFSPTATFNRNTYMFFRKWLKDVAYDQTKEGGVPHIVPNTLQFHVITDWLLGQGTHSAAAWADVAIIIPWVLYEKYGDIQILQDQFESMKKWIDFMKEHSVDYIWNYKLQFGDWVALDAEEGSYYGATPNDLTCTAYFAHSTELFVKICKILDKNILAEEYDELHDHIVAKYQKTFFNEDGSMKVQTQTAHIVSLYFNLTPSFAIKKTAEELKQLLDKENGHLVTGFVGTPYFCYALSRNGYINEAYDLLLKKDFPSWLYQIEMGATTIWEHWDGIKPDGTMWSPDMNSFNHYAYGAVGEWLYQVAGGLNSDAEDPGYHHIIIAPKTGNAFSYVNVSHESIYGEIRSEWKKENGTVILKTVIPANTYATVLLEDGSSDYTVENATIDFYTCSRTGLPACRLGSGAWTIKYNI